MMTFDEAMALVATGRKVRRADWPVRVFKKGQCFPQSEGDYIVPEDYTARWHVWRDNPYAMIKGFGGSIGADADENSFRDADGDTDGMTYTPTDADRAAMDWEVL